LNPGQRAAPALPSLLAPKANIASSRSGLRLAGGVIAQTDKRSRTATAREWRHVMKLTPDDEKRLAEAQRNNRVSE